ncbi:hypothetical protein CLV99_4443 [Sphingobacterium yanglingense]|uniref:Ig-like domain-containing protein n=2 Tax=Sphingobacterium yanglingense TaxID=1437280 RepID=A0A4R6W7K6_9SPHI|nr:hypothetical protein CLV99_4443 [Sphingobacterium yanglingense]
MLVLLFCLTQVGYGQAPMKRIYATSQKTGGALLHFANSPNDAVDGKPYTYSTIGITLIGDVWQRLQFPTNLPAGTTVRIKIGTTGDILGLLGNILIQAYQNDTSIGNPISIGNLITLLAGEDQAEIVFIPTLSFNSIRIYSSGIKLGGGLKIYEAYYLAPSSPTPTDCDTPTDILYGSTGNIAGGLNAIESPYNAIDGNPITYTTMRANVSAVGNRTHLTALYNTTSHANDSVRIILQRPGALLDATILSNNFRIRSLLDNTDNGYLLLNPSLLSLRLLTPGSDIQVLTYPIASPFNRLEISLGGGLVNALSTLHVHEIQRIMAKPKVTALNIENNSLIVCEGETTTLLIENPESTHEYRWYTDLTESLPIHTGTQYILPQAIGTFTYYVSKSYKGCTEESDRTQLLITVISKPGSPHVTITNTNN